MCESVRKREGEDVPGGGASRSKSAGVGRHGGARHVTAGVSLKRGVQLRVGGEAGPRMPSQEDRVDLWGCEMADP